MKRGCWIDQYKQMKIESNLYIEIDRMNNYKLMSCKSVEHCIYTVVNSLWWMLPCSRMCYPFDMNTLSVLNPDGIISDSTSCSWHGLLNPKSNNSELIPSTEETINHDHLALIPLSIESSGGNKYLPGNCIRFIRRSVSHKMLARK